VIQELSDDFREGFKTFLPDGSIMAPTRARESKAPKERQMKSNVQGRPVTKTIALAFMLMLTTAQIVSAQGVDWGEFPEMRYPKLEGTWRVQITLRDCQSGSPVAPAFPALASFARGGTVITADGGTSPSRRTSGHGIWAHAGGRTYQAVIEAFLFSPTGEMTGTQRITQVIELGHDPMTFTADVSAQVIAPHGVVVFNGCATSAGTRLR
jgi:hypothetical protein